MNLTLLARLDEAYPQQSKLAKKLSGAEESKLCESQNKMEKTFEVVEEDEDEFQIFQSVVRFSTKKNITINEESPISQLFFCKFREEISFSENGTKYLQLETGLLGPVILDMQYKDLY